jgi:hypothetical protein
MSIYSWQETYISTLLETDELKRRAQILETRAAIEQRLPSPVGDEELRALGVAAAALQALEAKRPNIAQRISDIRNAKNPRARDLDI